MKNLIVDNPAALASLPTEAQAIFNRVFHTVLLDTANADQAGQTAWAQVRTKYRKVEDKWVPLSSILAVSDNPLPLKGHTPEQMRLGSLLSIGNTHKFLVREKDGTLNRNAVKAVWEELQQASLDDESKKGVAQSLESCYYQIGEEPPKELVKFVGEHSPRIGTYLAEPGFTKQESTNLFEKRILHVGKFLHPANPAKWFEITEAHLDDAIKNFGAKVLDRVNLYWTHNEDPRNIGGETIALRKGTDLKDGTLSLYATVRADDINAADKMKNNNVGISAGLDNVYREHTTGNPVGMVLRHLALVGDSWVKHLGGFTPLPVTLSEYSAMLGEGSNSSVIYMEEEKKKVDPPKKEPIADPPKKEEEQGMPDLKELLAELKDKHGIDVGALQEAAKATVTLEAIRKGLKLEDTGDKKIDLAETIVQRVIKADDSVTEMLAESAVLSLLSENKITPAMKDQYKKLWLTNKELFGEMTKDLKKVAVPLGEKGHTGESGKKPGEVDTEAEIERGTTILAEVGVEMKGYKPGKSNGNGKSKEDQ